MDEKYLVPPISSYRDFWEAKTHTLMDILTQLSINDLDLNDMAAIIDLWVEAWSKVEIFEGIQKVPGEKDLDSRIDEFLGKLVELQLNCKDSFIKRCEERIEELEGILDDYRNSEKK